MRRGLGAGGGSEERLSQGPPSPRGCWRYWDHVWRCCERQDWGRGVEGFLASPLGWDQGAAQRPAADRQPLTGDNSLGALQRCAEQGLRLGCTQGTWV